MSCIFWFLEVRIKQLGNLLNERVYDMDLMIEKYVLHGHTSKVNVVEFSKNDQLIASGSEDFTIKLWQLSN